MKIIHRINKVKFRNLKIVLLYILNFTKGKQEYKIYKIFKTIEVIRIEKHYNMLLDVPKFECILKDKYTK